MSRLIKQLTFSAIIAIMTLASATEVLAQDFKFGHVNSQELLATLPERTAAEESLKKHATMLENQQKSMNDDLNKKYAEYLAERESLSALVRQTREKDIQNLQQSIQVFSNQAMIELQEKEQSLIAPIIEKVQKAISEVGKENGFTYIFDLSNRTVVYHSAKSQDITALVRKKLGLE